MSSIALNLKRCFEIKIVVRLAALGIFSPKYNLRTFCLITGERINITNNHTDGQMVELTQVCKSVIGNLHVFLILIRFRSTTP